MLKVATWSLAGFSPTNDMLSCTRNTCLSANSTFSPSISDSYITAISMLHTLTSKLAPQKTESGRVFFWHIRAKGHLRFGDTLLVLGLNWNRICKDSVSEQNNPAHLKMIYHPEGTRAVPRILYSCFTHHTQSHYVQIKIYTQFNSCKQEPLCICETSAKWKACPIPFDSLFFLK